MNKYELFLKEQLNKELDRAVSKMPAQPPMPEKPAGEKNSRLLTAAACILVLLISGSLFMLMPQIKENRSPIPTATAEYPQVTPRYTQDPTLTPRISPENTLTPMPSVTPVVITPSPVKASGTQTPVIVTPSPQQNVQSNATPDPAVVSQPGTGSAGATAAPAPLISLTADYSVDIAYNFFDSIEYNDVIYISGYHYYTTNTQNFILYALDAFTLKTISAIELPGLIQNLKVRDDKLYFSCGDYIKCYEMETLTELYSIYIYPPSGIMDGINNFDVYNGYAYYMFYVVDPVENFTNTNWYGQMYRHNIATGERTKMVTYTEDMATSWEGVEVGIFHINRENNVLLTGQNHKLIFYSLMDLNISYFEATHYYPSWNGTIFTDDYMYSESYKISYSNPTDPVFIYNHLYAESIFSRVMLCLKDNILVRNKEICRLDTGEMLMSFDRAIRYAFINSAGDLIYAYEDEVFNATSKVYSITNFTDRLGI